MKFSIEKKTIAMIVSFAAVLIIVATVVCSRVIYDFNDESYLSMSERITKTVAEVIDVEKATELKNLVLEVYDTIDEKVGSWEEDYDKLEAYLDNFSDIEKSEAFIEVRDFLRKVTEINGLDCMYLSVVDPNGPYVLYLVDSADEEDACRPGTVDELYEVNKEVLTNPKRGFPAYITNTNEYGWLVTSGAPVFNEDGKVELYVFADISMEQVSAQSWQTVLKLLGYLILSLIAISIIGVIIVDRVLVKPLRKLSDAAFSFRRGTERVTDVFSKLNIRTGDEIMVLYDSLKQMEKNMNAQFAKLMSTREELAESVNRTQEISELANKDSLTGVHNKTSYDSDTERLDESIKEDPKSVKFGIAMIDLNYLKMINDSYGHDCGDIAITKTANIICKVFRRSPVYRVGGDEFVVVFRNSDYDEIDSLVAHFKDMIKSISEDESLQPWERISAAIGTSIYDPENDNCVADVFRHADKAMYENKRIMKEGKQ